LVRGYGTEQHFRQSFSAINATRTSEKLTSIHFDPSQQVGGAVQWARGYGKWTVVAGGDALDTRGTDLEEISGVSLSSRQRGGGVYGEVLWQPDWPKGLNYTFNLAGFVIHGAVHEAKPELHCVIHTHSLAGTAVASLKRGLLPMMQTGMRFAKVAYHDYEGVVLENEERARLLKNLGDCEVMLLRNHGVLAVGKTVAEAFNNVYRLERACRAQLLAQACDDELVLPSRAVFEKTSHMYQPGVRRTIGLLEWPAMRRLADRLDPSYKT